MDWLTTILLIIGSFILVAIVIQVVLIILFIKFVKKYPIIALFILLCFMALSFGELFTPAFLIGLTGLVTGAITMFFQYKRLVKGLK